MSVSYYPLTVIKKEFETEKTCSFYLSVPKQYKALFSYKTAQFLTFRFLIEEKEYVRSYSIASSPFLEEPLRTTVGKVKGGIVSNHLLSHIKEGDQIESQVPLGEFFKLPKSLSSKDYILFASGIGITPLFSILKTVLTANLSNKVYLFFSISNQNNFIYKKELELLKERFKDKLNIKAILSQKEGRLDSKKLQQILKPIDLKESFFYLCGPKDYMKMIQDCLLKLETIKSNIFTEDFKVIPQRGPKPTEASVFFNANKAIPAEPKTLKATLEGENLEIPLNREKSLLEQLIDQGYNPPFSCTSGSCMTCMAKLKEGKIFQLEEGILDEENIKNLEVLTCQCYPLSETVNIDYDNL